MSKMFVEFDGAPEARSVVRRLRGAGSDFIKLRLTRQRPLPSLQEATAVVEEAHRLGLKVAAHTDVPHDDAVQLALAAGVDTLEHNAVLRLKDPTTAFADIVRRGVVVVPGMANWEARMETLSRPPGEIIEEPLRSRLPPRLRQLIMAHATVVRAVTEKMVKGGFDPDIRRQQAFKETRAAYDAGVLLATGPDTGVSLMPHGRLYKDAYWLAAAGLPIEQVVRAATMNGARAAGIDKDTGSLEAGKAADIVIVKGNLSGDYRRLKDVLLVVRDGRVVFDARTPYVVGCQ
jgi:imidazolonepropionase-like amidohydrolase